MSADRRVPLAVDSPEALFHALLGRVDACLVQRKCFEIVQARDGRYVQYLVDETGAIVLEAYELR